MCHGGQIAILTHLDNSFVIKGLGRFLPKAKSGCMTHFNLLYLKGLSQMFQNPEIWTEIMTHLNLLLLLGLGACFTIFCLPYTLDIGKP